MIGKYEIACDDAVEWLQALPSRKLALIVTDPAYESLEKHRAVGTTTRLTKEWFPIFPNGRFLGFFLAAYGALRKNAHLYMLCDQETMRVVVPVAEQCGFRFWKALIWDKMAIGMGYHYRARHEFILFFEKGKRGLNDLSIPDVLAFKRVVNGYPTEKPVDLLRVLIRQSSDPGDIVADPFMGSGSTGVAALKENRRFMGTDIEEGAYAITEMRLEGVDG